MKKLFISQPMRGKSDEELGSREGVSLKGKTRVAGSAPSSMGISKKIEPGSTDESCLCT